MPVFGIVSSYDVLCGNAAYTKALADGLREKLGEKCEVKVIALDSDFLHGDLNSETMRQADEHIEEIIEQIRHVDYVNIQFELGLFASRPDIAIKRAKRIIAACTPGRFSVTMHRVDTDSWSSLFTWKIWKSFFMLRIRSFFGALYSKYVDVVIGDVCRQAIRETQKNGGTFIVHTKRELKTVKRITPESKVFDHPLRFTSEVQIANTKSRFNKDVFFRKHGLSREQKLIGVFGFLTPHKGFETAIEALHYLPSNYVLGIFGGTHPFSIKFMKTGNSYIKKLTDLVSKFDEETYYGAKSMDARAHKRMADRVKFFGAISDEDMIDALLACDHTVIPYHEVGQGGSAVGALALEFGKNVLMSRNLAFGQLEKYSGAAFEYFDIGNANELANRIKISDTIGNNGHAAQREKFLRDWSLSRIVDIYVEASGLPPHLANGTSGIDGLEGTSWLLLEGAAGTVEVAGALEGI